MAAISEYSLKDCDGRRGKGEREEKRFASFWESQKALH